MSRLPGVFLSKKLFYFLGLLPFESLGIENLKSRHLKTIIARSFKLGQLREDDERITL